MRLFFLIILLSVSGYLLAETSHISGRVVDAATERPLVGANVTILGTSRGAATDLTGLFEIENLALAQYTLKISYMGYEPKLLDIQLEAHPYFARIGLVETFFQTEQVVVTATRTKKTLEDVPVVTQIIDQIEIRETGAQSLADVLSAHPGLVMEKDLAGGENIRMCGIDGRFILVLVDGVPLAGKFNNRQQLDLINAHQIDHIEIVKGPGSSLYGSEAMGGVINVITKKSMEKLALQALTKTGSFGLYDAYASVSGNAKGFSYLTSAEISTGGIDPALAAISLKDVNSIFVNGKLSYSNEKIGQISSGININLDEQLGGNVIYDTDTDAHRGDIFVSWNKNITDKLLVDAKLFTSVNNRTFSEFVRASGRNFRTEETRENITGIKSSFSYNLCPFSRLDVGYDYSYDYYESERVLGNSVNRTQHGLFINSETNYKKLTVILGARMDTFSEIGTHYSPRLSAMYSLSPQFKIRSTIGTGFRAPSFIDMYLDYNNTSVGYRVEGNPDLRPEKSIGQNIGIEYFWNYKMLLNATIYRNDFTDMILDYNIRPGVLSYKNIDSATFTTLELDSKWLLTDQWTMHLNYNYTQIDELTRKEISTVSPHSVTIDFGYKFSYFNYSIKNRWFSRRQVKAFDGQSGIYLEDMETKSAYNLLEASVQWNAFRFFTEKIMKKQSLHKDRINMRFGILNLLDYTDMDYGPWFGKRFFIDAEFNF